MLLAGLYLFCSEFVTCPRLFLVFWMVYKEFMISTFSNLELISLMINNLFEICRVTYNVYGLQHLIR